MRKILFWTHLAAGCVAGAIILLMSATGVLLTYEKQILAWAKRGGLQVAPGAATRLPAGRLAEAVRLKTGELPGNATLTLRSDPREPAEIRAGRDRVIYADPYTGGILADGAGSKARAWFQEITAWHRWLGVEGPGRGAAKAITGACTLCFVLITVTGTYLWMPRRWSTAAVRSIAWFRGGVTGRARDFNWHNVFGIWAMVPLFFIALTALPMSYPWANDLLYRMTGSTPPPAPAGRPEGRDSERRAKPAKTLDPAEASGLWQRAELENPEWKSITARLAIPAEAPATFTIDTGNGGQPQKRTTLTLDPATREVVRREPFAEMSAGRRLRMWTRFAHTGEYYGIAGQTVAGAASAAGVMLAWTGISLALRRLAAWRGRRNRACEAMYVQAE